MTRLELLLSPLTFFLLGGILAATCVGAVASSRLGAGLLGGLIIGLTAEKWAPHGLSGPLGLLLCCLVVTFGVVGVISLRRMWIRPEEEGEYRPQESPKNPWLRAPLAMIASWYVFLLLDAYVVPAGGSLRDDQFGFLGHALPLAIAGGVFWTLLTTDLPHFLRNRKSEDTWIALRAERVKALREREAGTSPDSWS
jgi:hypothetical protein